MNKKSSFREASTNQAGLGLNPAIWVKAKARTKIITRFDDGTFETDDGITGTWGVLHKDTGEEVYVIVTEAGRIEIPIISEAPDAAAWRMAFGDPHLVLVEGESGSCSAIYLTPDRILGKLKSKDGRIGQFMRGVE